MTLHAFVDESFQRSYTVAAAVMSAGDVNRARGVIRGLLRRGQLRIHFKKESDARRSQILDALETLDLRARLYVVTEPTTHPRDACLAKMIPDLAREGVARLVIERDESLVRAERQMLYALAHTHAPDLNLRAHASPGRPAPGGARCDRVVLDQGRTLEDAGFRLQHHDRSLDSAKPRPPTVRTAAGPTSSGYCPWLH